MKKFKLIAFDLFFVVSGIIGVGFATGKEIDHFFLSGKYLWLAVIVFFAVFVGLSVYILYIKNKHDIVSLKQLNKFAFGKYYEIGNIMLLILFLITNSAMLAGCDNIVKNYLSITFPIASLILSIMTFFIINGGVERIKRIANIVMPGLIVVIIVNACCNFSPVYTYDGKIITDIIFPIIFCCENFMTIIPVLINSKSKIRPLSLLSGLVISIAILFSALAIFGVNADMPMLSVAKNLGNWFFVIYLFGVLFALFTTLQISAHSCLEISSKNKSNKMFASLVILLVSQIVAYLGFNFIVKYLYSAIGVMGGVYLVALVVRLIIVDKKSKK